MFHSTVVSLLRMRAEQQPYQIAYAFVPESGPEQEVTYSELDRQARAIACMLADLDAQGQPALLLYPPGLDYIAAFFGCLYAGVIAVPTCPPDPLRLDRSLPRLAVVARDAIPSAVLTTAEISAAVGSPSGSVPELSRLPVITTDDVPAVHSRAWDSARVSAESIALLQYTSGSTSAPKGVVLTHRNLMSNSELIFRLFGHSKESRGMIWLPPHHDMGLIGGIIQPLYGGFPMTLMAPADFLRRPLRWLAEISRTRATTSGGPNFAYDLCVRKTTPEERMRLDLSSWQVAFNGSEPIRAETMEDFAQAFAPAGFHREAFHPCYGLAEATLIVTGGIPRPRRDVKSSDAAGLRYGSAISGTTHARSRRLVSCGLAPHDRHVVVVDPDTRVERAAGQIGEIWISGDSVARSYWRQPAGTGATFGARLAGTGEGPFLRSGDLGFVLGRQLFVTGRIKDLIVIRGRNYHPQDIELTAERSSPVLRRGCAAAFAVADGDQERLVVAHEITRQAGQVNVGEVADAVRAAVAAEHEVQVHTVVLLPPGEIPKTSSGKIQRGLCAAMFADGQLAELGRSAISPRAEVGQFHLRRSVLPSVPAGQRQRMLRDYLRGLLASACGIDAAKLAADAPLLALGIDSCAAISIQQSIQADLGAHVTASDLAHAASLCDLATRLDEQLSANVPPSQAEVPASAPAPGSAGSGPVRLYCWASGSRVPVRAALSADLLVGARGQWPGAQPRWASLGAVRRRGQARPVRRSVVAGRRPSRPPARHCRALTRSA
jgi:acyl-CoA synthetase (AMP-forming)/AMP-acid ligase II